MDSKIKEQVLKIVQKVCVKTYQYAINQAYLDRQRHDGDKEWEKAMNAEREGTLEKIKSEINHCNQLDLDIFDGMYLLMDDLKELDKIIQKRCLK